MSTHTIPSLQGTLAKRSKPPLQPNFAKEPFSPSRPNALTADPDKTKNGGELMRKWLIMKDASA